MFSSKIANTVQPRGTEVVLAELIRLQIYAASLGMSYSKRIRSIQTGGYLSPFRGRGMEFDEVRAYQAGDDVRMIDWRVTARSGHTHTKLFREERERPVVLFVDQGASMQFGTRNAFKSVLAAHTAALLAWAAAGNGDRIGGVISAGDLHKESRPLPGKRGVLSLLRSLAKTVPSLEQEDSAFENAFVRLCRVAKHGSLIYLIGDFRQLPVIQRYLTRLSQHNDLVLLFIHDPMEYRAPPAGYYPVTDGRRQIIWNTASNAAAFKQQFLSRFGELKKICRRLGVHMISLSTANEILKPLRNGLQQTSRQTLYMDELNAD